MWARGNVLIFVSLLCLGLRQVLVLCYQVDTHQSQVILYQLSKPAENELMSKVYQRSLNGDLMSLSPILIAVTKVGATQIGSKRSKVRPT